MLIKWEIVVLFFVEINGQIPTKLALEEFQNSTDYLSIVLESNHGQSTLIQIKKRIWDKNINEQHLDFYSLQTKNRILITTKATNANLNGKMILFYSNSKINRLFKSIQLLPINSILQKSKKMKKFIDLFGQLEIKVFLLQQRERKNLKISIGKMLFNIENNFSPIESIEFISKISRFQKKFT